MKIVRTTLHTHTEWFKLQMCKDRFDHFLKIDSLKEIDPPVSHTMSKVLTDECGNGSSQITTCSSGKVLDEGSSPQVSSEVVCDESAILKVMVSGIYLNSVCYLLLINSFHDKPRNYLLSLVCHHFAKIGAFHAISDR